jgi:DUF1680 family protein
MTRAKILPGYWYECQHINAEKAIYHQWEQLVASGCIENFRIAAGESDAFREGWFFADSDAFKWLDAAARIYATHPSQQLAELMDDFIALIGRAQTPDGYIYTYNQIHFPDVRWTNLQIEHELYCHGHLIEAGVSHQEATGRDDLLKIAIKAADRIVADFKGKGPAYTPGHQEIEIALLRLYQTTQNSNYLDMSKQFIEQRGRQPGFALQVFQQNDSVDQRKKQVAEQRQAYLQAHPDYTPFQVPAGNEAKKPPFIDQRWMLNAISGKYFQQHKPVNKQTIPVGHSVRFAYLETAAAMLARLNFSEGEAARQSLEQAWEHMVTRRMYVTGGIGSLPALEGFGNDYELDPEFAYTETCAALGCMFWNWEMTRQTIEAKYADLFEWQLYNASRVGMGIGGDTYFYNNPLTCDGGVTRQAWYEVPCCPSNISRTWADIGKYLVTDENECVCIHQYVNSETILEENHGTKLNMQTGFPWQGNVRIQVNPPELIEYRMDFRIPSWATSIRIRINGELMNTYYKTPKINEPTASGYDPRLSDYEGFFREWKSGDTIELDFGMDIQLRRAHPKVKGHAGKVAISAGPLVYCLESVDNPEVDIFNGKVDTASLELQFDENLLGGCDTITGKSLEGKLLTFIPYYLWGNRGPSQMTVWVNENT